MDTNPGIRRKFHWIVKLVDQSNNQVEERVEAYWDPEKDGTGDAISHCGRIQANARHNSVFAVIGAPKLVG